MGFAAALFLLPGQIKQHPVSCSELKRTSFFMLRKGSKRNMSMFPVARLFRPAIFEASKLKVLLLGVDEQMLPRTYTLTHSDVTSELTLAISQTINRAQLQGWYNRLQRDEVVAEWKKVRGKMSLHVHCHISGGHILLDFIAGLRHTIFTKELPVVLKAIVYGDGSLFASHPELEEALVWIYFHSTLSEFNRVECWGPLRNAVSACRGGGDHLDPSSQGTLWVWPQRCELDCDCCFPTQSLIPWPHDLQEDRGADDNRNNEVIQWLGNRQVLRQEKTTAQFFGISSKDGSL